MADLAEHADALDEITRRAAAEMQLMWAAVDAAEGVRERAVPCRRWSCRRMTWRNDALCSDRCAATVAP